MRPIRLEVQGFTTYRDPVVVEFDDVPYFALVGPTGSGKSSLIDAMTFALYGSVPRLDMKSVAPVIAQGELEARIRFDFAVADQTFTAVRVVRKRGDGATTKEARLDRDGETIAGNADEVTEEVGRLLGLGYEHFTKCVVLPQGAFARFLHDKPADRGDLLVELLDLGVYGQMQQTANARASAATVEAELVERRLNEELAFATPEHRDQTRARIGSLAGLLRALDADEERLALLRESRRAASETVTTASAHVQALAGLGVPDEVSGLSRQLEQAQARCGAAEAALADAEEALRVAEKELGELPARGPLNEAVAAHRDRTACIADSERARASVTERAAAEAEAARVLDEALAAMTEAERAHDRLRLEHRAHELAAALQPGDDCPVCGQTVHAPPAVTTPEDLEHAARALAQARERHASAAARHSEAQNERVAAGARADQLAERLAALDDAVAAHPDIDTLTTMIERIETAQAVVERARAAESAARSGSVTAVQALDAMQERIRSSWQALDAARDRVADLGPPSLAREHLAADWTALATWAVEQADAQQRAIAEAERARTEADAEGLAILERQRTACREHGMDDVERPRDACLQALQSARDSLARIEEALETVSDLRAEHTSLIERAQVARALAQHLKANAFEAWILDEALRMLQEGATEILTELSGGQYALTLDKNRNFAVIDHRNADEVRAAKTLSGGETFLASLALALALADRIAQLSANGAVRLESIFLDEGFGALDPETLDVVEAAIANLAAAGRVVGMVTHVRDLAERVPVRYEVRRGPTTSTVEKVLT